jgi:ATP-dependent helicase/nuclease subunit B
MLRRTVWALKNQIAESGGYVPREYEVSFYDREVDLGVQGKMRLQGKIDRVDIQEDEETVKVRIVDYKTGKHAFDLGEVCHGLQMQLIVYMNAAMDMQKQLHPDKRVEAGGLYYYQMQDPIVEESEVKTTIEETILKKLNMNGVAIGEKLSEEQFQIVSSYANAKIRQIGKEILDGQAEIAPYKLEKETGCQYCPYRTVCGFDERMEGYEYRKLPKLKGDDALAKMNEEVQSWE